VWLCTLISITPEIHPFAYFFDKGFDFKKQNTEDIVSYFEKSPHSYKHGLDYIGKIEYEAKECYWFMHKISDILNAILCNDVEIQEMNEYNFDMDGYLEAEVFTKFPLSYILTGKKK